MFIAEAGGAHNRGGGEVCTIHSNGIGIAFCESRRDLRISSHASCSKSTQVITNEDTNLARMCHLKIVQDKTSRVRELKPLTWSTATAEAILVPQIVSVPETRKQARLLTGDRGHEVGFACPQ